MQTIPDFSAPARDVQGRNLTYYVDAHGTVVWTNRPFADFAEENGAAHLPSLVIGTQIINSFSGVHRSRWGAIYEMLLAGRLPSHVERFSCPSPTKRREYLLRIEPVTINDQQFLRHETILIPDDFEELEGEGHLKHEGTTDDGGIEFAAYERPLEEQSGDGIWTRDLGGGRIAFMIADAMGHGPVAAAAVRQFIGIMETDPLTDLRETIIRANRQFMALPENSAGETPFITGLLMIVDHRTSLASVVCFGHQGVIFTPSGPVELPGGLPVGIMADFEDWPVESLDLKVLGARFLAFTDGIVEQFDAEGEMYSTEKLTRDFAATTSLPLIKSIALILAELEKWRGSALVKDDQTLLAVQLN